MRTMELRRDLLVGTALICVAAACGDSPEGRTYYERNIEPILIQKCSGNTSGCHAINDGDPFAIAAGNLDVTSFENVQKRRDTLTNFGAYPFPLLLIKAVGSNVLQFQYGETFRPIEIEHGGGGLIEVGSDAYFTLQTWLDNGATENGLRPATPAVNGIGPCTPGVPAGFDAAFFRSQPGFARFRDDIEPILEAHGCGAGSCHGAPQSDFFLTCGDDDDQVAFNFSQAWAFVNDTGIAGMPQVLDSQLLRVPLAAGAGGRGHTGGDQFPSTEDPEFVTIQGWAESVGKLDFANGDPLKQFFADHVQPIFVQRGCASQGCHSPQGNNDFKLRAGSIGFFSAVSLRKNYELVRNDFMAMEFPDARRGRVVAKSILEDDDQRVPTGVMGIVHRGGAVLETPGPTTGSDPAACPTNFDPAVTTTTPFCIVQEWLRRERAALIAANQATDFGTTGAKIVFVNRPAASADAGRLEFDDFRGGATLLSVDAAFDALGVITAPIDIAGAQNLSQGCAGLAGGGDIQSPNVANDGDRVVFTARASAAEALGVYIVQISTGTCQKISAANPADSNGLKVHDFDPVFSPDGANVVFASTRGKNGALRSRKRLLPQSDLWRAPISGLTANLAAAEQMTFLSNSEVGPGFMREGRVTMTTEKASSGFYQLSGRRINWDLTDYHPLLAQRKDSLFVDPTMADLTTAAPSIGFSSATDIYESSNGDFLLILSEVDPTSGDPIVPGAAGALAIFNRSIGPFEQGRNDTGYLQSVRILDEATATGRTGTGGGYRRPRVLPDGRIMVSFASNVATGNFVVSMIDPRTQQRTALLTGGAGGDAQVDAVLAYRHPPHELYENRRQLVFGGAVGAPGDAVLHLPDAPMTFTLLVANLRRGRPLDAFDNARFLAVYQEGTCPTTNCTAPGGLFESRTMLGRVPLESDGSVKVTLPSGQGVVLELQDDDGNVLVTMGEEHQLGPGEQISMGVQRQLFDGVCGGCHGSISARELDVAVTPDALTGASQSLSLLAPARTLGN
jgi:hypothetical protein